MAKVAVIIDDLFEDSEYTEPVDAFEEAGHDVMNVGLHQGEHVEGKSKGISVEIDEEVSGASEDEFDALFIPGGYSPDRLRSHPDAVNFVKGFMQKGKPVFAICHGPQLLITAGLLSGKKVTGWKSIKQDIKNAGAEFLDQPVVEDGNLITSRSPADIPLFNQACLKELNRLGRA
ncbi:MAG: type 1 glutamine amidotransferase domain-containing protein [Candidatus Omnitrophota bacterium]